MGRGSSKASVGGGGDMAIGMPTNDDFFRDRFGDYYMSITAIQSYVGTDDVSSDSARINRRLINAYALGIPADKGDSTEATTIRALDKAMEISPIEKDMTLYRGVGKNEYFKNMKVGDVVDMNGSYTSASESRQVAEGYFNSENGYLLRINVGKGTPSINVPKAFEKIGGNANARKEKERILSRKLKYVVKSIENNVVALDVIG